MMIKPVRIQLSRKRGFSLQETSAATNGLFAVSVARPTKWGNPWRVVPCGRLHDGRPAWAGRHDYELNYPMHTRIEAAQRAVACFRDHIAAGKFNCDPAELRHTNLACWCALDMPCHADVLLEAANLMPKDA